MEDNTIPLSTASKATTDPNWLRSFKGCEHYSDEQAIEIIETLHFLAKTLLNAVQSETNLFENKHVVHLNNNKTEENKAA